MDIKTLMDFLNTIQSYHHDLVLSLGSNAKLCHYTTLEGALSILEKDDLWLSHLRFSNDDEELKYGHQVVRDELRILSKGHFGAKQTLLDEVQERLSAAEDHPIYICCFCEVDNLLSQWRGYAENGGGVSIEFEPEGFKAVVGGEVTSGLSRLWRVFYDQDLQRRIVDACIDYPYWGSKSDDERAAHIVDAIHFFVPTFKNQDFRGEQERRLIFTPGGAEVQPPQYRVRSGMIVPYVCLKHIAPETSGKRLPIRAITVGPGRYRDLNRESITMALSQWGYTGVEVRVSTTPYRG
ncbi:DUF2971 domain-containing protein [Mesorhizobium opportunistum]|uniref:DUF2971 domain-containing protein n=1 Tax=Mesorhizobium opportunistum TaxID=593909 RepID=A0ABV1YC09_9HYPH|nr:DUF2971 domain-containing protein [Mesorhizobium sp.]TJV16289.1 MAG: DUF2971 domain-containing protein [Mesorhizobium sp.]